MSEPDEGAVVKLTADYVSLQFRLAAADTEIASLRAELAQFREERDSLLVALRAALVVVEAHAEEYPCKDVVALVTAVISKAERRSVKAGDRP